MKPSFVVSLLLLSLILAKTQGIRLGKVSSAVQQQKQHDGETTLLKRSNTGAEEASLCKENELCTGSQKKRAARVSRKSNNQLPNIHEDYYGPRRHRPRHH
ncbi:hypothetical protein D0Y65_045461 [Glycine soja]|uniref:Uncharacterized protein n=1 Tax=Glycine soja TaxID=3848 RepID=A0A445G520_GLYSO|nr:hypothetical protein D0Y65_045461 [Glycine soja]